MKIALVTDTHAGARNDSSEFADYFEVFYEDIFFPTLELSGIKHVIHLGDMFDRRKYINYVSLSRWKDMFLNQCADRGIDLKVIVGNHDAPYKNSLEHNSPLLLLNAYSNVEIIDAPREIEYDGTQLTLIPWMCSDNEEEIRAFCKKTTSSILLGHLELNGYEMYAGVVMHEGLDDMDAKWLQRFEMVMSGHFHHKSHSKNIYYLGSPYEMNWADYDDQRGFHIFDTDTHKLTYIVNPHHMFHKIWYDDSKLTVEDVAALDFSGYKNKIVKVVVKEKNKIALFDVFLEKLEQVGVIDMQIVDDHLNRDAENDVEILAGGRGTLAILSSYIDSLEVENKDDLKHFMHTLYNQAIEANAQL